MARRLTRSKLILLAAPLSVACGEAAGPPTEAAQASSGDAEQAVRALTALDCALGAEQVNNQGLPGYVARRFEVSPGIDASASLRFNFRDLTTIEGRVQTSREDPSGVRLTVLAPWKGRVWSHSEALTTDTPRGSADVTLEAPGLAQSGVADPSASGVADFRFSCRPADEGSQAFPTRPEGPTLESATCELTTDAPADGSSGMVSVGATLDITREQVTAVELPSAKSAKARLELVTSPFLGNGVLARLTVEASGARGYVYRRLDHGRLSDASHLDLLTESGAVRFGFACAAQ